MGRTAQLEIVDDTALFPERGTSKARCQIKELLRIIQYKWKYKMMLLLVLKPLEVKKMLPPYKLQKSNFAETHP